MELSKRILEILEKSGLTPSEFADKIEVQRSAISHITSGRNKPSLDFLIKLKHAFPEIDTEWLIFGKEKKEENLATPPSQIHSKNLVPEKNPTLFDALDNEDLMLHQTSSKKIRRIVFIYEDGSFEDFVN